MSLKEKLNFHPQNIEGTFVSSLNKKSDHRGYFMRIFENNDLEKSIGKIVQTNVAFNEVKGTWRGMHYQKHPSSEFKIVICIQGSVLDFLVDMRKKSKTFMEKQKLILNHKEPTALIIPPGVAHGYYTLENKSFLIYGHTDFHQKKLERGINFKDPKLRIDLPDEVKAISDRDQDLPFLESGIEV